MPPKLKLHKHKEKCKESITATASRSAPSATQAQQVHLDQKSQEQFEIELCWCIQQLQRTLNCGKLNQKQMQDSTKTLNTLMNNSVSFIKKRQLMRLTFGDYRTKMAEEDAKLSKAITNTKILPASPSKNSLFFKKASSSDPSSEQFKFNFSVEDEAGSSIIENISKVEISQDSGTEVESAKPFQFKTSDNTFRFNFEDSVR